MARIEGQKLKILVLADILARETDSAHGLTVPQLIEALAARGFTIRPPQEVCDLYVVNTCTVTADSDRKARQAIRRLLSENPEAFLIVTGCSAQKAAGAIAAIRGVDCIVGNRNKLAVADAAVSLWRAG